MAANLQIALERVRSQVEHKGGDIKLLAGGESNVVRGDYGSVIEQTGAPTALKSFPIRFTPTEKQLQKAGIIESVDVIFWLSKKALALKGIVFDGIDTVRSRVIHGSVEYRITQKGRGYNQFGDYLYITLGGKRK